MLQRETVMLFLADIKGGLSGIARKGKAGSVNTILPEYDYIFKLR